MALRYSVAARNFMAGVGSFKDAFQGGRLLPMWLSRQGVCVGMPEMVVKNLTRTRYGFKTGDAGAAMFQPGPNKFIATSNFSS